MCYSHDNICCSVFNNYCVIDMNRLKNIIIINDWACRDGGAAAVALNTAVELSKKGGVI